ncbi:3-hydroxyanthranilate 3,4-dioxygenase [Nonomuraea guangzhouensis]|uniref:3-hydroxyanthranilate 3,4-dioxygenase n=1 Tax=Nonomuraea guangzhouensis TaxID=1291555 RepID=A0ABW4GAP0_9ACTN|nr:3-hydroxyanthranilate 3,4-dioxygenase [Nonomuraea guangzhouensis]
MNKRLIQDPIHLVELMGADGGAFAGALAARSLYPDSDFEAITVRGPNRRNDFHTEPYDEFFLQLRGAIQVDTREQGIGLRRHIVREGEAFLVPGGVPHSPHRPAGTLGLVVEIRRRPGDVETAEWWCDSCDSLVERVEMESTEMISSLGPLLEAFNASEQRRTCRNCAAVVPVPEEFVLDVDAG